VKIDEGYLEKLRATYGTSMTPHVEEQVPAK
jgi:hypothetical protein